MNWIQIYKRALKQTHTNENDYTSDDADLDMDIRYQELVDEIVSISKWDYFWDEWITDTAVWQSEYIAEKLGLAPDDLDIKKIDKVFVKYSDSEEFYTPVRYVTPVSLTKHPDYYKENQSKSDPFFYIQDNSIFIYPAPTDIVADWLQLFVIHKPAEIDTTSSADDIEIPYQFHKLISDWLRIDIYLSKGLENEAQAAQNKYDTWIRKMVAIMKERYWKAIQRNFKNNLNSYR